MLFSKSLCTVFALVLPVLSATVRINHLGDSITGSPGCWRALLWQKLQAAGIKNTDFVGTLSAPGCGFSYDGENDGHGGFRATGIVKDNQLPGWLSVSKPDIVTMMLGTNDVWAHLSTDSIIAAFTTLVGQMRAQNPKVVIIAAQLLPMYPSGCTDCNNGVVALNKAIPGWAAKITTSQSPVTVIDLYNGFNAGSDTSDGVHPNNSGAAKIADKWFGPLSAAIKSFGGSTTLITTTVEPTMTVTTSTPTNTSCAESGLPLYSQCGGQGYSGGSVCSGCAKCTYSNEWYSQCLP